MADSNISVRDEEIYEILEYMDKKQTIQNLEKYEKNSIKKKVKSFLEFTNRIIKVDNFEFSLKCLNIFQKLNEKLNFFNIFGDNRLELILNYNIACCHQINWSTIERIFYLKKTLSGIENFLRTFRETNNEDISLALSYKYLYLKSFYLLVLLQITAVYSSDKEHSKAQDSATKALKIVEEIFSFYYKLFLSMEKDLEKENAIRYNLFFENFKKFLDMMADTKNHINLNKINILKFIQWKHTPENNEKIFGSYCKNVFPSKKFEASWLKNFNIGDIMHIQPINIGLFENNLPQILFKNDEFILKLIIYCSTACYSLSTEKRYLAFQEIKYNPENYKSEKKFNLKKFSKLDEYKKKSLLKKNQKFIESEYFHLKSIEILQNFIEDFTLTNYIKDNYKQSYSDLVNFITEEEEPSQSYSNLLKSNSIIKKNDSYYDESKNIIINNITITKTNCNIMNNLSFENSNNNEVRPNDKNFLKNIYKQKFKNDEDILFSKFSIQEESVAFSDENLMIKANDKISLKNNKDIIKNIFPSSKENNSSIDFQQSFSKFNNFRENSVNCVQTPNEKNSSEFRRKNSNSFSMKENKKNLFNSHRNAKNSESPLSKESNLKFKKIVNNFFNEKKSKDKRKNTDQDEQEQFFITSKDLKSRDNCLERKKKFEKQKKIQEAYLIDGDNSSNCFISPSLKLKKKENSSTKSIPVNEIFSGQQLFLNKSKDHLKNKKNLEMNVCFNYNYKKKSKEKKLKKIKSCRNRTDLKNELTNKFLKTVKKEKEKEKQQNKMRKKKITSKIENGLEKQSSKYFRLKKNKQISLDIKQPKNLNKKKILLQSELQKKEEKNSPKKKKTKILEYSSKKKENNNLNRTKEKIFPQNNNLLHVLNKYQTIDMSNKNKVEKFFNPLNVQLKIKNQNDITRKNEEEKIKIKKNILRPLTSRKRIHSGIFNKDNLFSKSKNVEEDKSAQKLKHLSPRIKNFSSLIGNSFQSLKWNSNLVSFLNKKKNQI